MADLATPGMGRAAVGCPPRAARVEPFFHVFKPHKIRYTSCSQLKFEAVFFQTARRLTIPLKDISELSGAAGNICDSRRARKPMSSREQCQ